MIVFKVIRVCILDHNLSMNPLTRVRHFFSAVPFYGGAPKLVDLVNINSEQK